MVYYEGKIATGKTIELKKVPFLFVDVEWACNIIGKFI